MPVRWDAVVARSHFWAEPVRPATAAPAPGCARLAGYGTGAEPE